MADEQLADLTEQLQQARREADYYRRLSKECGERRLKEAEDLSNLIAQLRQTEKELAQARDELEQRVQERTTELRETNERLTREMNERLKIEEALRQVNEKLISSNEALEQERRHLEEKVQERTQELIFLHQERVRELSTPLLPILDNVVIMPLIGTIDSQRAQQVMETLLQGAATYQATVAILDITSVRVVDTQVAQALIRTAQAAKLLGTQVVLTGIQPHIAQTLVHLGADLGNMVTRSTLQAGMTYALRGTTRKRVWQAE